MSKILIAIVCAVAVLFAWTHRDNPATAAHSTQAQHGTVHPGTTQAQRRTVRQEWAKYRQAVRYARAHACTTAAVSGPAIGAGIQAGPVRSGHVTRGRAYTGQVYVTNTGSAGEDMTLYLERLAGTCQGRTIPAAWFHASPVSLAPGQGQEVSFQLAVPASAAAGPYYSDIVVSAAPSRGLAGRLLGAIGLGGGSHVSVRLGAAAATLFDFRVTGAPLAAPASRITR